jgi:hypothetical protein
MQHHGVIILGGVRGGAHLWLERCPAPLITPAPPATPLLHVCQCRSPECWCNNNSMTDRKQDGARRLQRRRAARRTAPARRAAPPLLLLLSAALGAAAAAPAFSDPDVGHWPAGGAPMAPPWSAGAPPEGSGPQPSLAEQVASTLAAAKAAGGWPPQAVGQDGAAAQRTDATHASAPARCASAGA